MLVGLLGDKLPRACVAPATLGPAIVKADCVRLRLDQRLALPRFAMYALNAESVRDQAKKRVHGVGRPRLRLKDLKALRLPMAPLGEQGRLVSCIESYMTRLDDAVASLERVRANLKRYRASVLKAASGIMKSDTSMMTTRMITSISESLPLGVHEPSLP